MGGIAINRCRKSAFTLAELLIALSILGVVATFTIPKVLQSQQDARQKAIGKETAGMLVGALDTYKSRNTFTGNELSDALTQYMNYVSVNTVSDIDRQQGGGAITCSNTYPCLKLHNGAMLLRASIATEYFGGTGSTNAVYFFLDPDGQMTDGTTNGPGKSVVFFLYSNGRISTWGTLLPGTVVNTQTYSADSTKDPNWFGWD